MASVPPQDQHASHVYHEVNIGGRAHAVLGNSYQTTQNVTYKIEGVASFAWKLYRKCKTAPESYYNVNQDLTSLHAVLKECEEELPVDTYSEERYGRLNTILEGCHKSLQELETIVQKYEGLALQQRRTWDRMRWHSDAINDIRARLNSNVTMLTAFLTTTQASVCRKLEALLLEFKQGKLDGSVVSHVTVDSINKDERAQWRLVRKEFEEHGITLEMFTMHRNFIFGWFADAVAGGQFDEELLIGDSENDGTDPSTLGDEPSHSQGAERAPASWVTVSLAPPNGSAGSIPWNEETHAINVFSESCQTETDPKPLPIKSASVQKRSRRREQSPPTMHTAGSQAQHEGLLSAGVPVKSRGLLERSTTVNSADYRPKVSRLALTLARLSRPSHTIDEAWHSREAAGLHIVPKQAENVVGVIQNNYKRGLLNQDELDRALIMACYLPICGADDVLTLIEAGANVNTRKDLKPYELDRDGVLYRTQWSSANPLKAAVCPAYISGSRAQSPSSSTPLSKLKVLCDAGADVRDTNALIYAALQQDTVSVEYLLSHGADICRTCSLESQTFSAISVAVGRYSWAKQRWTSSTLTALLTKGPKPTQLILDDALAYAVCILHAEACRILIQHGACPRTEMELDVANRKDDESWREYVQSRVQSLEEESKSWVLHRWSTHLGFEEVEQRILEVDMVLEAATGKISLEDATGQAKLLLESRDIPQA